MAKCTTCGHSISFDDRYCSRCGTAVAGGPSGDESDSLLLSPTGTPAHDDDDQDGHGSEEHSVRTGPRISIRPVRVALLLGALALVIVSSVASLGATDDTVSAKVNGLLEPIRSAGGRPTLAEMEFTAADEGDEVDGDDELPPLPERSEVQPVGEGSIVERPLVGEETGLHLVIGSTSVGGGLQSLDLDTGRLDEIAEITGQPVGMTGNNLIVIADGGSIIAVDLVDADAEPKDLAFGLRGDPVVVRGDLIWYVTGDDAADRQVRAVTVQGQLVEAFDIPLAAWLLGLNGIPELFQHLHGGVYRREGDGYRRLSNGSLLANGEAFALVEECDDAMVCSSRWYSKPAWQPLGFDAPEVEATWSGAQIVADRWLIGTRRGEYAEVPKFVVSDIVSGIETARLPSWVDESGYGFGSVLQSSSDGRWIAAFQTGRMLSVFDLENQAREWRIELPVAQDYNAIFADSAQMAEQPASAS